MWARCCEIVLGIWLVASPWIFGHSPEQWGVWVTDLTCGVLMIGIAAVALWLRQRAVYLLQLIVAGWLVAFGYLGSSYPAPPAYQNEIIVGLSLLMFGILPTRASVPPASWERLLRVEGEGSVSETGGQPRTTR